ncbi:MAG: hypothetical protein ACXADF_07270 [Candidatus Thorarchaeota archaeon]|jgi:hypothetical protein
MFFFFLFLWIFSFISLIPLMEDMEPHTQGVTWGILIGTLILLIVSTGFGLWKETLPEDYADSAIPLDMSVITRVVREKTPNDVVEHIIYGGSETTFREACEESWLFETIAKDEEWIIQDSHSNDITDKLLIECEGIASIMVRGVISVYSEETDHLPEWWDTKD